MTTVIVLVSLFLAAFAASPTAEPALVYLYASNGAFTAPPDDRTDVIIGLPTATGAGKILWKQSFSSTDPYLGATDHAHSSWNATFPLVFAELKGRGPIRLRVFNAKTNSLLSSPGTLPLPGPEYSVRALSVDGRDRLWGFACPDGETADKTVVFRGASPLADDFEILFAFNKSTWSRLVPNYSGLSHLMRGCGFAKLLLSEMLVSPDGEWLVFRAEGGTYQVSINLVDPSQSSAVEQFPAMGGAQPLGLAASAASPPSSSYWVSWLGTMQEKKYDGYLYQPFPPTPGKSGQFSPSIIDQVVLVNATAIYLSTDSIYTCCVTPRPPITPSNNYWSQIAVSWPVDMDSFVIQGQAAVLSDE